MSGELQPPAGGPVATTLDTLVVGDRVEDLSLLVDGRQIYPTFVEPPRISRLGKPQPQP